MTKLVNSILRVFELFIVSILMVTMMIVIFYACYLLAENLWFNMRNIDLTSELKADPLVIQEGLYRVFGNMLTVLLGLELIHTVKIFFSENRVKLESIMVISVIAIARHLITMNYHDTDGIVLIGLALILAVFIGGYLLIMKERIEIAMYKDKQVDKDISEDGIPVLTEKENI